METERLHLQQPIPVARSILWKPRHDSYYILAGVMRSAGGDYKIFIPQRTFITIEDLVRSSPKYDRFGLLTGHLFRSPEMGDRYMVISSIVPAPLPVFDPEAHPADGTWESGPVDLPRGEEVLGWYRTRTAAGSQLSAEDTELHDGFFPDPWQIALILVPASERPAGSFYRLERKVNRSYIAPFHELLHTRPRRDEAAKHSCVMWESYLTDEEIVPLEDRDVLSSASVFIEAEPAIAGDPALDWLEARLRSLWSRIRGDPNQGVNGAEAKPKAAPAEPVPPRRPPQSQGRDVKRTTPSRLSTLVSQPDPKIARSKTPTKPSAVLPPSSGKQAARKPPARSPMIDVPETQPRRPTPVSPSPAVQSEPGPSPPQRDLGKQLREALSAWDTEGGQAAPPRKTSEEPSPLVSAEPPVAVPTTATTAPAVPRVDEAGAAAVESLLPDITDSSALLAGATVPARHISMPEGSAANPLVVLSPDFEDRRSVTFFELHRNPILAAGGAAIILFAILVVLTRPAAPPSPVIAGSDSASARAALTRPGSADPAAMFDLRADSLDRAIAFYRTVHVDFTQRRLSCRALAQSRAAVAGHAAALAQTVEDSGERLNSDRRGRYDRLKASAGEVERGYDRSDCEQQTR